jgi:hypothetical protein
MKFRRPRILFAAVTVVAIGLYLNATKAQSSNSDASTKAVTSAMPAANDLPVRKEMPDLITMNDGTKITTVAQWRLRREEMKRILEHYELGHAPPPPGNVSGLDLQSRRVLDGAAKFRLVHLKFGP